jgi:hypothetical protein
MRSKSLPLLLLLLFLTAWPGSVALAGEKKTLSTPVRLCVYWVTRSGPNAVHNGRQVNPGDGLRYEKERKGRDCERSNPRTLWHI